VYPELMLHCVLEHLWLLNFNTTFPSMIVLSKAKTNSKDLNDVVSFSIVVVVVAVSGLSIDSFIQVDNIIS
jgi:hypothetical protein